MRRVRRAWAPPTGTAASAKWAGCARTTPAWVRLAGGPPLRAPTPNPLPSTGSAGRATPRTRHALPAADVRGETDVPGRALRGHRRRLASQAATPARGQDAPREPTAASTLGWEGGRSLAVCGLGGPVGSGGEPEPGPVTSPWALQGWQGEAAGRWRPLSAVTAQSRAREAPDQGLASTSCRPPSGLAWTAAPPAASQGLGGCAALPGCSWGVLCCPGLLLGGVGGPCAARLLLGGPAPGLVSASRLAGLLPQVPD